MALFKIQIFKSLGGTKWSNVYLLDSPDLATAQTNAGLIVTAERSFHYDVVSFDYMRVSSVAPDDDVFTTVPINSTGDLSGIGDYLPLWNTFRVDITVEGGGRPSRKYYRLPISEGGQTAGVLVGDLLTDIPDTINTLISDMEETASTLVDNDTQAWTVATAFHNVQMRQLHRKRRSTPA